MMATINAGFIAAIGITSLLLLYSGMLFDPPLIKRQLVPQRLMAFGILMIANYVAVPVATLVITWTAGFPPVLNVVLLTMAMLPCASTVPPFVSMVGEPPEHALSAFIAMSLLNILVTPLLISMMSLPWVMGSTFSPPGGTSWAFFKYFVAVFTPMSIGALFNIAAPTTCRIWRTRLLQVLRMGLPLSVVPLFYSYHDVILGLGWRDFAALLLFESVCVAAGFVASRRTPENRTSIVLVTTLRNTAMGLAFALVMFPHTAAPTYMLVFITLTFFVVAIGVNAKKRWSQRNTVSSPIEEKT